MNSQVREQNATNVGGQEIQIAKQLIQTLEKAVDDKIEELEAFGKADIEQLREERVKKMKEDVEKKKELLSKGHGKYEEIEEKLFFKVCQDSNSVVALFHTRNEPLCDIFHMHLKELAAIHVESRFVSIDAEKSPFLVSRLSIDSFPTIIVIVTGITEDKIVRTKDLGGKEDFPREALEWRLSLRGGIKYDGEFDPKTLFAKRRTRIKTVSKRKTIREEESSESDD